DGVDSLDEIAAGNAIQSIAARLPRYGVTAFCPTTVACRPDALRRVLDQVRDARSVPPAHASRVLPAHLESNFINPVFRGAQPAGCLRAPARIPPLSAWSESATAAASAAAAGDDFTSDDILREIERARPDVGIVTVASEID